MKLFRQLRTLCALMLRLRPRHGVAVPLLATLVADAWLLRRARQAPLQRSTIPALRWERGLSIVIPERGGGEMLARCLEHLALARQQLNEPSEVIIVVNGSPREEYSALTQLYPALVWQFHVQPLGFTQAVLHGLRAAKFGGVYLLNNDMILAADALSTLLPVRAPFVFAIASQIEFEAGRRREETGWTKMQLEEGLPNPYHAPPEGLTSRGTVWAGAGAALFERELLAELLPGSLVFDPFYWEDVDLGLRAWRLGYDSLLCPASHVVHGHRVTVKRYYPPAEVARIFERNRVQLHLRHPLPVAYPAAVIARLLALELRSLQELTRPFALRALWQARHAARHAPCADLDYETMAAQLAQPLQRRPCLIMVSPFALLPARHGGAVRSLQLAHALAQDYNVILLSDERELYSNAAAAIGAPFAAIHLVSGRAEPAPGKHNARIARMLSHSHRLMRSELRRLIETRRPVAVLVEHMELAPLIDVPTTQSPAWILHLHDVLLQPEDPRQQQADAIELAWMRRYNGLVVSSPEDQALIADLPSCCVANGIDPGSSDHYRTSSGMRNLLFIGPFRSQINFDGIVTFLQQVYPELLSQAEGVTLTIVGGPGSASRVTCHPCFAHPSITLLEQVDDIDALIRAHALTINPQETLRGSSLKVIESLAAGRVCVSTRAGARGHLHAGFAGLICVDAPQQFIAALQHLLHDEAYRLQIEKPQQELLARYAWSVQGERLREYVAERISPRNATG